MNIPKEAAINCEIDTAGNILLTIKNNGDLSIRLSQPCTANTFFNVMDDKLKLERQIQLKVNPECTSKEFELRGLDEKVFTFDYNLSKLYDLKKGKKYKISAIYYPNYSALVDNKGIESESFLYKVPD